MKSRAPLVLIGQTLLLFFFALAAAICLRLFAYANTLSTATADRDTALQLCQNAAELLKSTRGDLSAVADTLGGTVENGAWQLSTGEELQGEITIITNNNDYVNLGKASVTYTRAGEELITLTAAWQEVKP